MPTTGYAAAIDSNDIVMEYILETTWGTTPASPNLKAIRLDGEGFSSTKNRQRPNEIQPSGQASAAITTKVESKGDIKFSVSAGTHNDLLASSIGGSFSTPVSMSVATIGTTATTITDSGNGFVTAGIVKGQMLKMTSSSRPQDNCIFRVTAVAAGSLTIDCCTATLTTQAAAAMGTVTIKGSMARNGTTFDSYFFQKQLAAALFLTYNGCFPTGGNLDVAVGDYLKGGISFLNKAETKSLAQPSGATHTAAPTGTVVDSINGIGTVMRSAAAISAAVQKIGVKWAKEGAAAQFAIGSSAAQGMRKGVVTVSGNLSTYFKDFTLYDQFVSETGGMLGFPALDGLVSSASAKGYYITICNATIMNPKVVAGGPGQDVMAEFDLEGNPETDANQYYGGKTIQIDYFA